MSRASYYETKYYDWQKSIGEFGGIANLIKFEEFITPTTRLVDFGCGGGFLLSNISCESKIGVEINPVAASSARTRGLSIVKDLSDLPSSSASLVISNHALEHVLHPFAIAVEMLRVLEPGGRAIVVVPCDNYNHAYAEDDVNQHLYSWSPMNLGNLFKSAGFEIERVNLFLHTWPKNYQSIARYFGWRIFHALARLEGRRERRRKQVRLVARKPLRTGEG